MFPTAVERIQKASYSLPVTGLWCRLAGRMFNGRRPDNSSTNLVYKRPSSVFCLAATTSWFFKGAIGWFFVVLRILYFWGFFPTSRFLFSFSDSSSWGRGHMKKRNGRKTPKECPKKGNVLIYWHRLSITWPSNSLFLIMKKGRELERLYTTCH